MEYKSMNQQTTFTVNPEDVTMTSDVEVDFTDDNVVAISGMETFDVNWDMHDVTYELKQPTKKIDYKFNESQYVQELQEYVDATYNQHYAVDKFQATEFIMDGGHGTGFCIGNVLKYAQRYGKKGTRADARKDLMKVLHYALMQLHVHDNEL